MRVRPKSPQDQRRAVANNTAVERARTIHHPLDRRASPPSSSLERDFCRRRLARQKGREDDVSAQRPEIGDQRARTIHHPLDRRAMTGPRVRNARQSLQNLIGPDVVSGSKAVVEAMSDQPGEADVKGVLAKPQRRCASCFGYG